jgi:hypothetical protein
MNPLSPLLAAGFIYLYEMWRFERQYPTPKLSVEEQMRKEQKKQAKTYTRFKIKRSGAIQDFENTPENQSIIASWKSDSDFCVLVSENAKKYSE